MVCLLPRGATKLYSLPSKTVKTEREGIPAPMASHSFQGLPGSPGESGLPGPYLQLGPTLGLCNFFAQCTFSAPRSPPWRPFSCNCWGALFPCSPTCSRVLISVQKHPHLFSPHGRVVPVKVETPSVCVSHWPRATSWLLAACSLFWVQVHVETWGWGHGQSLLQVLLSPTPAPHPALLLPRHEAQRLEQEARGRLERQKILDQSEAEKARKELLELEAMRWVKKQRWKNWPVKGSGAGESLGRAADSGRGRG